jgi:hypothetical protein
VHRPPPLNLLQRYSFKLHRSKAGEEERSGQRFPRQLVGNAGLGLLEAVLFQFLGQIGFCAIRLNY